MVYSRFSFISFSSSVAMSSKYIVLFKLLTADTVIAQHTQRIRDAGGSCILHFDMPTKGYNVEIPDKAALQTVYTGHPDIISIEEVHPRT